MHFSCDVHFYEISTKSYVKVKDGGGLLTIYLFRPFCLWFFSTGQHP